MVGPFKDKRVMDRDVSARPDAASTVKSRRKPRIFYGWWMVAASFGLQFLQSGVLHQSLGAYVAILAEEFGWSKTALSGVALIQQVEHALLGPVQGWIVDRFGPRQIIRVSSCSAESNP
jgi:hypothetical protein